jgi:hypothetical protein
MKTIMKLLGIIALVAIVEFSFVSCDNGNGGGGGGGSGSLVGKWYGTQETANSGAAWAICYEFKANGELLVANEDGFTYTASGGKITAYIFGYALGGSANYKISGTALTIYNAGDSGFADGTYYKPR